ALLPACSSRPEMIGRAAPDFAVSDGGRSVTLSQFRGQVLVLNFWATYCAPCIEELPSLQRMAAQMKDRNIAVLAISEDPDEDASRKFLAKYHIELPSVRDASQANSRLYRTTGIPETFIIDARGILRRKFVGPVDWTKPEIIEYLRRLQQDAPARAAR